MILLSISSVFSKSNKQKTVLIKQNYSDAHRTREFQVVDGKHEYNYWHMGFNHIGLPNFVLSRFILSFFLP
jgi:hypothetical protein